MIRRRSPIAALAAAVLFVAGSASADDPSAEELKARGNRAMMNLDYAEALADYRAALAKAPNDVALHYNIGRAQQARGDYPAALDALLEFKRTADADIRAKVPSLDQLIEDVRGRVGQIAVHCTAEVAPERGSVVVSASGAGGSELARLTGCKMTAAMLRMSLPTRNAAVEVHLESTQLRSPRITVNVEGGAGAVELTLPVAPISNQGLLRVRATPGTATVSVDGVAKGNPPVEVEVAPGSHYVDVAADDFNPAHVPFVVEAGGTRELEVPLEKTPPITKRWWFWAGAGVIAVGVLTTAIILIAQPERSAEKGTIDPGTIRAPLVTF